MKRQPHQVIQRPIITEKTTRLLDTENKYAFRVHPSANKLEIKAAIEKLFNVKVVSVTTMNLRGKPKQMHFRQPGKRSNWKKAVVKLSEGESIELF